MATDVPDPAATRRLTHGIVTRAAWALVGMSCGVVLAVLTVKPEPQGLPGRDALPVALAATSTATHREYSGERPLAISEPKRGLVREGRFTNGLPADWSLTGDANFVPAGAAGLLRTGAKPGVYALMGPLVRLKASRYAIIVRGSVISGGMQLGLLNADTEAWSRTGNFSERQRSPGSDMLMRLNATVSRAGNYRVILANWSPVAGDSLWHIKSVRVFRRA